MHTNTKSFFENHPHVDEFHYTEDGQHFTSLGGAEGHAADLKRFKGGSGKVVSVTRKEAEATDEDTKPKAKATAETVAPEAGKEAAEGKEEKKPAKGK